MKTDTKRTLSSSQLLVVLIMIVVLVWAVGLIVSKAVFDTISFNNHLIARKRTVDSTLSENLKVVDGLRAKYDQVETIGPGSVKVLRALPEKADLPGLVSKLEALLTASGVSFDQFSLSGESVVATAPTGTSTDTAKPSVAPAPQELSFSIQVSGSYSSLLAILENLEHEISPMRVTKLTVGGTISAATATIDIKTYYQDRVSTDFAKEVVK